MAPTTAKLKHDIDHGRSGDKVDVVDPTAAHSARTMKRPGRRRWRPPLASAVEAAHQDEVLSNPASSERNDSDHGVTIYLGMIATLVLAFGVALWLTL